MILITKICSNKNCKYLNTEQPLDNFSKNKYLANKIRSQCHSCDKVYRTENKEAIKENQNNYYKNNKEKIDKKHKDYYEANKERLKNHRKLYSKKRYQQNRDDFIKRREIKHESVRGRMCELLCHARDRSRRKGLEFNLDLDWIVDLFNKLDGKCTLSNIKFEFKTTQEIERSPFSPSIDRIDSKRGYVKDNVRLVCTMVNLALSNFGDEAFLKMCEAVTNKQKEKVQPNVSIA